MHIEFERVIVPFDERRPSRATARRLIGCALAGIALAMGPGSAHGKIHKCIDPTTRAITLSQIECPDTRLPSAAEVAASAEATRAAQNSADSTESAERADRQLLEHFPDEAAHRKTEGAEIESVVRRIRFTIRRYDELAAQREPLDVQAAFYVGKTMPAALRRAIDDNEASFKGLVDTFHGLERNVADIVARYGTERARLRKLWSGASAGSMGPLDAASAPTHAK